MNSDSNGKNQVCDSIPEEHQLYQNDENTPMFTSRDVKSPQRPPTVSQREYFQIFLTAVDRAVIECSY